MGLENTNSRLLYDHEVLCRSLENICFTTMKNSIAQILFWDLYMSRDISSTLKHICQNEMVPYIWEPWNDTQIQGFFSQDKATLLHIGTMASTSLHRSRCVANCFLLLSFSSGHSHCSSSPGCLWWGHLQSCYAKCSEDHFSKAIWEGIYCQQCKQAPAATDSPSRGLWEIQPSSEWQWVCAYASRCPLSPSLCFTSHIWYSRVFDVSLSDFTLFFLIIWLP